MGAGLAERPPCLPHGQDLMGAGLVGTPPCLPRSQGPGLTGGPPCPCGCWFSWETPPLYHTVGPNSWVLSSKIRSNTLKLNPTQGK